MQNDMRNSATLRWRVPSVMYYLAAGDAFLSTASCEELPKATMEATAPGLCIGEYDIRGCNDLVFDGGTCFLVRLRLALRP